MIGKYVVLKREPAQPASGWSYGQQQQRELTLFSDSTYNEVNMNWSSFELISPWGTWGLRGDTIVLTPCGELPWEESNSFRKPFDSPLVSAGCIDYQPRYLLVLDGDHLKILSEGFLEGSVLSRH